MKNGISHSTSAPAAKARGGNPQSFGTESLGCYDEVLTYDQVDSLASVIKGDVDWRTLPPTLPISARTVIERCLLKDQRKRLADMSVVHFLLTEPMPTRDVSASVADGGRRPLPRLRQRRRAGLRQQHAARLGQVAPEGDDPLLVAAHRRQLASRQVELEHPPGLVVDAPLLPRALRRGVLQPGQRGQRYLHVRPRGWHAQGWPSRNNNRSLPELS